MYTTKCSTCLLNSVRDEDALEFPTVYASATQGYATLAPTDLSDNIFALFETILEHIPTPEVDPAAPLQMLITTIDYNDYVGRIGIGRVFAGTINATPSGHGHSSRRDPIQ